MMQYPMLKAAAAHVTPIYCDPDATAAKAADVIAEAAANGADLVAFPESFLPGFPLWAALFAPIDTHPYFARFAAASVRVDGPQIARIRQAAQRHSIVVSLGFSEAAAHSVGCLWNSNLLIDADGTILVHHRKLVPTFFEKLVWAAGDGEGLRVAETRHGRIGALICGENTNPLARYSLMAQGEQVHISSWPPLWPTTRPADGGNFDNRSANRIRAGAHSFEAKAFGIAVTGVCDDAFRKAMADGCPAAAAVLEGTPHGETFFVDVTGKPFGDSAREDEAICYAQMDLSDAVMQKRLHDVVGYYNRYDVFDLRVERRRHHPVSFEADRPANVCDPAPEPPQTAG